MPKIYNIRWTKSDSEDLAKAVKNFNANYAVQTIVTCENDDRCRDIYKNIKDELEECEKEKIKNERN